MNFDFGWHLVHADRRIFVEVALNSAAAVDGDFVGHDRAQPFDDSAADLIFSVDGIDDLAADVAGDPDFVDLDFLFGVDTELHDLGEIAAMRELEGNAHGGVFRELTRAPAGFSRDELEDTLHARSVEIDIAGIGRGRDAGDARRAEKIQAELDRIFSRSVSELVGERLKDPGEGVASGGAQSVGGNTARHT